MLNQNCKNNMVARPEANKKPRVSSDPAPDQKCSSCIATTSVPAETAEEDSGRERLKRHRMEMAGRVWIPDIWGQESFLKEWVDCSAFDTSLVPKGAVLARQALVEDCRRTNSARCTLQIQNRNKLKSTKEMPKP